jgi:hypothetical protein
MYEKLKGLLTQTDKPKRIEFITEVIRIMREDPKSLTTSFQTELLKLTVICRLPWFSAFLINAGFTMTPQSDCTWSFADSSSWSSDNIIAPLFLKTEAIDKYKRKVEEALFTIRYRQFISRNHADKIISALFVKTPESNYQSFFE